MPRIAASLAVFLAVVTCIGFNTARYPAVWEMLATPDESSQSALPKQPATIPKSSSSDRPRESIDSTAFSRPDTSRDGSSAWQSTPGDAASRSAADRSSDRPSGYDEIDPVAAHHSQSVRHAASRESPDDAYADSEGGLRDPTEAAPAKKYGGASSAGTTSRFEVGDEDPGPSGASGGWDSQRPLVPVEPSATRDSAAGASGTAPDQAAVSAHRGGGSLVRRLPPVDQASGEQVAVNQPPMPDGAIPIYPTTGIE